MSYEPTNWKAGDVVTSAKLNKMEQGIAAGGGIRFVHFTINDDNLLQLDITPNELIDAFENEEIVVIINYVSRGWSLISEFMYDGTTYTVSGVNTPPLASSDPDEYFTHGPSPDSSGDNNNSGDNSGIK